MILLNEHGKQAATVGPLRNVWSLGSYDPSVEYMIEVDATEDGRQKIKLPVQSVGRKEGPVRYYFAADLRFVSHKGFVCVLPEAPIELQMVIFPSGGGFKGSLSFQGEAIFTTPQFMPTEKDVVSGLARWAQKADKRFVMPAEVVQAVEAMTKKAG